ncbi:hypothetical protein [Rivularia sp. PCC 7116]|uniref:hypothetical protein n=1 Tax=Rivularia sp. PCC 7116 TaxID=373994 RepID=UPI0002DAE9BC|nr:hypothetical protein [Rivularia sp. PCC 7116]
MDVNIHGHSHPKIAEAIYLIFAGFTHQAAGLNRVFYSDNGSTAVEVALKIADQY